jgi:hypothetical protein
MPPGSSEELSSLSPCPFWTKPITHVGLPHITTIQTCVRGPTHTQLCSAGFPGGFKVTALQARFTVLMVSRGRGACASLRHLEERNCTSTVSKLSMTLTVSTPHPWPVGHFEGTDRSFALYAVFPRAEYYGHADSLQTHPRFSEWFPTHYFRSRSHRLQGLPCSQ